MQRFLKYLPYVLLIPAVLLCIQVYQAIQTPPDPVSDDAAEAVPAVELPKPTSIEPKHISVFQYGGAASANQDSQYRLAGSFFLMSENESEERKRLAIIDDLSTGLQHIVSEGQPFQEYDVLRIYKDRLILRKDGEELVLTLSFTGSGKAKDTAKASDTQENQEAAYATSRFGKQVGETRWVLQKEYLNDYYQELLDDPERIAAIYSSLKPDRIEGQVKGYKVDKEGEDVFFNAVGLQNGDVIRKVNSMDMISQNRGEYFLSEYVKDRLGAVVLDIERNGEAQKLIYLLR